MILGFGSFLRNTIIKVILILTQGGDSMLIDMVHDPLVFISGIMKI